VQNVKQSVVIRLDKSEKRKRTYRRKSSGGGGGAQQLQPQSLPPNVIYQSNQITPVPYPFTPEPVPKITDEVKLPKTILEDTGIVGTEGKGVRILELPTKREQLGMMIEPIQTRMLPPKQEKQTPSFIMGQPMPESQMPNVVGNEPAMVSSKTPKIVDFEKNAQKMERSQMGKEDNASVMLGLSQFNVTPSPKITANLQLAPLPKIKDPMGVPTFNFEEYQQMEKPLKQPMDVPLDIQSNKPSKESEMPYKTMKNPKSGKPPSDKWVSLTKTFNEISGMPAMTPEEAKAEFKNSSRMESMIKMRQRGMSSK
jgi:hypothetical protein